MTELAQRTSDDESTTAAEDFDDDSASSNEPGPDQAPSSWFAGRQAQKGLVWVAGAGLTVLVIAWMVMLSPGETGSRADWFFGAAVFALGLVTVWQTQTILRRAARDATEAADRLRAELAAAEVRAARQVALLRSLHETEREAQRELTHAEMEAHRNLARAELGAQRDLARVERDRLLAQQQKMAITEVSRAVNAHTHVLATLWDDSARILRMADREQRERAMRPIFDQIGQVVKDFSVELANAQLLIADDRLHRALLRVNEAVLAAMRVAEDVHVAVVEGEAPEPNPVPAAQRLLYERAAEARHLAWQLVRTSLDDSAGKTGP
ncbi:hypothetical protein ABGB19_15270 [Mycobacterium sp. B14F4]|uniref:hypothetical protein n=1 Tax=Mycobacterium sp. B14F4 TaxID=3153565 RepID=UPI00325C8BD7